MKIIKAVIPLTDKKSAKEIPHSFRVLVVDDDIACAQTLVWILEMLGQFDARSAHEGQAAIELAKSYLPDIVLLDIGLPGMNGYEICQAMNKEPALKNTIYIAQTGWGEKEHRERSQEAGFDHHLVKPVDIEALKNILLDLDKNRDIAGLLTNSN